MPSFTKGLQRLEAVLADNPRKIDDYSANPFGILVYDPKEEFLLRSAIDNLAARLSSSRHVKVVSLAALFERALDEQIAKEKSSHEEWFELEQFDGFDTFGETLATILSEQIQLEQLVAAETDGLNEDEDVLILVRAGVFYPFFHISPILESLTNLTRVPVVLCYPGGREGVTGLRFLDQHQALRGYRQPVF